MSPIKQTLSQIESRCIPLNRNNVDTDQIIPARFLKGTVKTGLGKNLFYDWRYLSDNVPNPEFALNQPRFEGGHILVAAHNFGCGSSREHAPWALKDFGFQAILAISFADIFKNNSLKNHVLPIALPEPVILDLLERVERDPSLIVSISLPEQRVRIPKADGSGVDEISFEIDPFRKTCLMEGVDDVGYTLSHVDDIDAFEKNRHLTPMFR